MPDRTTGDDAIGDIENQHFYFNESGVVKDDIAGVRTAYEYYKAVDFFEKGDLYNGTLHLGIMTHYIADLTVFGNVMNDTYWGEPVHYTDYMAYVNSKMTSYTSSEFDKYLSFDGALFTLPPDDAANAVAYNTTFDTSGIETGRGVEDAGKENCTWMDANYDWQDDTFKNRCGESLNYAVNLITDVLHSLYLFNNTEPAAPKNLKVIKIAGHSIELTWNKNTEKNLGGYSIFINKTGKPDEFVNIPINISKESNSYTYSGLDDEHTYKFRVTAYNILNKSSEPSNEVTATTLDVTPPKKPKLGDLKEITNDPILDITGFYTAEPGALIEVFLNNNLTVPAGSSYSNEEYLGFYKVTITLIEGNNNITIRAVDDAGNPSEYSDSKIIYLDSIKPIADAGANIEESLRDTPIIVQFDATNSTDNSGEIINYTWTIDYNYEVYYLYGIDTEFQFNRAGEYICELNVSDRATNWAVDTFWINITQLDIDPPKISSRNPDIDETNVSINITFRVKFNEPLDINSLKFKLSSAEDGELQIPKPSYDPRTGLTLKPFTNLTHGRIYTITITGKDLGGNSLIDGTWNFETEPRPMDFDGDQLPDSWEWSWGLDANFSDSWKDPDNDKLSNFDEYNNGYNSTSPISADTDNDGMSDYFERKFSLNPLDPTDKDLDLDGDGKTNYEEYLGADGLPGNQDWTDPTQKPVESGSEPGDDEDYIVIFVIIIIIIIVLLLLILIARKVRYKETGVKQYDDDDYLKTNDSDELGVGGDLLFEESNNYTEAKENRLQPETSRSIAVDRSADGVKNKGTGNKQTPEEIMARVKRKDKRCPKCSAELPKDTNYCFECGEVFGDK